MNKLPFSPPIDQPEMPVSAVPEAIQTEEGKCSEVLKDIDRAPEGKCAKEEGPFAGRQNLQSSIPTLEVPSGFTCHGKGGAFGELSNKLEASCKFLNAHISDCRTYVVIFSSS